MLIEYRPMAEGVVLVWKFAPRVEIQDGLFFQGDLIRLVQFEMFQRNEVASDSQTESRVLTHVTKR